MELRQLNKLMSESKHEGDKEDDKEEMKDSLSMFTKKFFTKHGWDFILM